MAIHSATFDPAAGRLSVTIDISAASRGDYELVLRSESQPAAQQWRSRFDAELHHQYVLPPEVASGSHVLDFVCRVTSLELARPASVVVALTQNGAEIARLQESVAPQAAQTVQIRMMLHPVSGRAMGSDRRGATKAISGRATVKRGAIDVAPPPPPPPSRPIRPAMGETRSAKELPRRRKTGPTRKAHSGRPIAKARRLGMRKAKRRGAAIARPRRVAPARSRRGAASLPATEVRRDPHIDFHESVRAGETNKLVVRLADIIGRRSSGRLMVAVPAGQKSVKVTVSLSAPGFDVKPALDQEMTIGRVFNAKRESVTYHLKARDPGKKPVSKEIRADFRLGNRRLGAVIHWTMVVPKHYSKRVEGDGRSRADALAISRDRRDCDLVIRVEGKEDSGKPPFQIRLDSEIRGESYSSLYVGQLKFPLVQYTKYMQRLFNKFTAKYRKLDFSDAVAVAGWRAKLVEAIDALGKDLWNKLPPAFRNEYFRLHDAGKLPKSILVVSDEMLIPWELVIPHRNGKALDPLGIAHVMGRWRPGLKDKPDPQHFTIKQGLIVNPKYGGTRNALWWSVIEARDLNKLVPSMALVKSPINSQKVGTLVKRSDVQVFHYTGHGQFDARDPDLSTLVLESNDIFPAVSFIGTGLLAAGPILYLNACGVGSSGAVLGQMGGFAAKCMMDGCSGVIAPYWSVSDDSAKKFALEFYEKLKRGTSIGEALQAIRAAHKDDPTYQAFAYFGDPWTRTQFTKKRAG